MSAGRSWSPATAPNEGVRLLRELLLRRSARQIAKRAGVDFSTICRLASGKSKPLAETRATLEATLQIPAGAWDEDPAPATEPRRAPAP